MKFMTGNEIRQAYIDFFKKKGHAYINSHSVIPDEDPTLIFTNAGMNQLKSYFLSDVKEHNDITKWAIKVQKCIRASGLHNDLDDIGKDLHHHTFFEMMGNWSFGDYFRKNQLRICEWAWQFLTQEMKLPVNRLYFSYFGGNIKCNLEPDIETKELWHYLGAPLSHIVPCNVNENFWGMAETGPCGPCSKIHYDRVGNRDAAYLVNRGDPDVLEIWNFVAIQYNRECDGSLRRLSKKHIDSGLGLERLASIMQNQHDNYATDLFEPLLLAIEKATGARPYLGKVGYEDSDGIDMSYRILADHARAITIALTDGGKLDSSERGYVLKRIIRCAVRYATEKFNAKPGVFGSLVTVVVDLLGDVYTELKSDPQSIIDMINEEEKQFLETLPEGRRLLDHEVAELGEKKVLPGEIAWQLYDTYRIPVELTQLMAEEKGVRVDMAGYEIAKIAAQASIRGKCDDDDETFL